MELEKLRSEIDKVDAELIQLLNKRVGLALRTKGLKDKVEDPAREKEVIDRIRKKSPGTIRQDTSERIFLNIIKESRNLQKKDFTTVGFQGEHGAYSEVAAMHYAPEAFPLPHHLFSDIFAGVESGQLDYGMVPVENSLAGSVSQVADMLVDTKLKVVGEVKLPIHHCLMTLPETNYQTVKTVYSHPQALGQCRNFLKRNKLEGKSYYDTAGSAMMLTRERPPATAIIANKLCAELYDLSIIKDNIEDVKENYTRFLVLSKKEKKGGNKCSIAFSTKHEAGALFRVMKAVSDAEINLTKIESRPIFGEPGKYAFLLDFQGSKDDKNVKKAIEEAKKQTTMFRFLGCYEEAQ